jgi:hypothetical protein
MKRRNERSLHVDMRRIVVLMVVSASLAGAESAGACSCSIDRSPTLEGFDAAATGRLIDVKQNNGTKFTYLLTRVYKNKNLREGEELTIKASGHPSACGPDQRQGERYGLRLWRNNSGLTTNSCAMLSPEDLRRAAERSGSTRTARSVRCGVSA